LQTIVHMKWQYYYRGFEPLFNVLVDSVFLLFFEPLLIKYSLGASSGVGVTDLVNDAKFVCVQPTGSLMRERKSMSFRASETR
jgi:hypothetical protein